MAAVLTANPSSAVIKAADPAPPMPPANDTATAPQRNQVTIQAKEDVEAVDSNRQTEKNMQYQHAEAGALRSDPGAEEATAQPVAEPFVRAGRKIGRNEPCPCGSGKKYKHCHGKLA